VAGAAEMRRRERRVAEAARMIEAVAVLRERGPGGFAGLDPVSAPAAAVLLERIAAHARAGTNPRVWESAVRVAKYTLDPRDEPPPAPKALPEGYRNPFLTD